jgi:hypothetical protein
MVALIVHPALAFVRDPIPGGQSVKCFDTAV